MLRQESDTTTVGVFGTDATNAYGAFFVNPTTEADTGGAHRQELTVHRTTYGPIVLGMLHGRHYGLLSAVRARVRRVAFKAG